MVTTTVDLYNKNIFDQSSTNASHFGIAYREAGLPVLAQMVNVVIFVPVQTCLGGCGHIHTLRSGALSGALLSAWNFISVCSH